MPTTTTTTTGTDGALDAVAERVAALLKERQESVGVCEATSGGLINAALQGVPRASSYLRGGMSIYSVVASKGLLPEAVRRQLGRPRDNYQSPPIYHESKKTFCLVLGRHTRERFGSTWAVTESGATEVEGLPPQLKGSGVFTAVAVVGPDGEEHTKLVVLPADRAPDRRGAMRSFALAGLELLEEVLLKQGTSKL